MIDVRAIDKIMRRRRLVTEITITIVYFIVSINAITDTLDSN